MGERKYTPSELGRLVSLVRDAEKVIDTPEFDLRSSRAKKIIDGLEHYSGVEEVWILLETLKQKYRESTDHEYEGRNGVGR